MSDFTTKRASSRMSSSFSTSWSMNRRTIRIECLTGLTLVVILFYVTPTTLLIAEARTQGGEGCSIDESVQGDRLYPIPPLNCQQGFFNKESSRCICDFGWSGPLCQICHEEPCIKKARVISVTPQMSILSSTPMIQFNGHGFPRPAENNYHCLFNETKAAGKWISPTRVDCLRPKNLSATESYELALVPIGLYRVIRLYENVYFNFYEPCVASSCPGICLQGLCVCKQEKTGDNCIKTAQASSKECLENQTHIYNATEFQPFSALIVSNDAEKPSVIARSIPQIQLDEVNGLILWNQPIGSPQSQWIEYKVPQDNCTDYIRVSINVPNAYLPQITSITKHKQSNLHRINGYIKFNVTAREAAQQSLSVVLKVYEGDRPIEKIVIESKRRFFVYDIYPYTGGARRDYFIFAEHPNGVSNSAAPGLPFTNCVIDVEYQATLIFEESSRAINYSVTTEACACEEWSTQVLWPRELLKLQSQDISGSSARPTIQVVISLDESIDKHYYNMYIAISCDNSAASFTAGHVLVYKNRNRLKVYPERIEVLVDPSKETSIFTEVNVELSGQAMHTEMHTYGLSPFFVIIPPVLDQISNETTRATYLFGIEHITTSYMEGILKYPTPDNPRFTIPYRIVMTDRTPNYQLCLTIGSSGETQQGEYAEIALSTGQRDVFLTRAITLGFPTEIQLPNMGVYELSIVSANFFPRVELIKINSINTTLTVVLEQRPSKYLSLTGDQVGFANSGFRSMRPELVIQPSLITRSDEGVWLTFVYVNGPQNSMAMIKTDNVSIGQYRLESLPLNIGIPVGSGFKHQIRVVSGNSEHPTSSNIYVLKVPYIYTIPGISTRDFEHSVDIVLDFRQNGTTYVEPTTQTLTRSTEIFDDCVPRLLGRCKKKFKRIDLCSSAWKSHLRSRLPSMQSFMEAVLYKRDCLDSGLRQEEAVDLLRCVISANIGHCQIETQINEAMLKCTQKSPSLYNKSNLFNRIAKELRVSRFDLCRFVNGYYKQLFYLNTLVPSNTSILYGNSLDKFLDTISSVSDLREFITLAESITFQSSSDDLLFISNWNQLYEELHPLNLSHKASSIKTTQTSQLVSVFLETTAELNLLSRQMASTDPPFLMNELVRTLLKREGDEQSNIVIDTNLNVEPRCSRESRTFQVFLQLANPTVNITVERLEVRIRFIGMDSHRVNYRLKSTLYNGRASSSIESLILEPGKNATVQWVVMPTFDFRLTRTLIQTAVVDISFEINGERKRQEAQSIDFQIEPAETLRTITLLYQNVTSKMNVESNPFSARISVMNIGYSKIRQVKLLNTRPDIIGVDGPLQYSLDSVKIDEKKQLNMLDVNLGDMKSGEARHVFLNFSTQDQTGFFRNLTFTCASESHLLDNYSGRIFYIRKQIRDSSYLISELSDVYQLYYFQADESKLIPLNSVFFLQEGPVQRNSTCFTSSIQAFRLADENKRFDSPLVVVSPWPSNINKSARLVAIFQIFPGFDVMQRVVVPESFWMTYGLDKKQEVNFIDLNPFTSASRIFYELVFSTERCEDEFSFLQKSYHILYPPEALVKYSIIAQIQVISPMDNEHQVEYKLLSTEPDLPFAILAGNGAIVFMNSTAADSKPRCAVLVAEDGNARLTNATIQLGGRTQINCSQPLQQETVFQHVLGGAHNLPFDYNKARSEFLNSSLGHSATVPPPETTTEQPGDEWTDDSFAQFASPHSTLEPLTITTREHAHEPDVTLSHIQLSTSSLPSISPDEQVHGGMTSRRPTTTADNVSEDTLTRTQYTTKDYTVPTASPTTSSALPSTATSVSPVMPGIYRNRSFSTPDTQTELVADKETSAEMVDMACRMRGQKPILQVLCDLATSVYRTHVDHPSSEDSK